MRSQRELGSFTLLFGWLLRLWHKIKLNFEKVPPTVQSHVLIEFVLTGVLHGTRTVVVYEPHNIWE